MIRKAAVRSALLVVVLLAAAPLAAGYADSLQREPGEGVVDPVVTKNPPENVTVIATDSNSWLGRASQGPRSSAELIAVAPDGDVVFFNGSHTRYWDVDPVPNTSMTVMYVAADHLPASACGGETVCTRNVVERVNLSTGEVTRIFARITPHKHSTRWHDVDRIDENHIVVADIYLDRVFVVNTTTDLVTWSWSAKTEYPVDGSGGPFPSDWTHLNDVEVLPDGRIMVSMRNHDQVVFLDRQTGLVENWTLGADDKHRILFEAHNPDYIPPERGGPAVVVADSENNRIVEYQRVNGSWVRTWTWRDPRLQWPRDADRLPNGHTLITDSNGDRVLEVNEEGEVVWSLQVAFPYEAERLGTGDESAGGKSATALGLGDATAEGDGEGSAEGSNEKAADGSNERAAGGSNEKPADGGSEGGPGPSAGSSDRASVFSAVEGAVRAAINDALRGPRANAVMYVLPVWMSRAHLAALIVLVVTVLVWAGVEAYWSPWSVSLHRPLDFERNP